MIQVVRVTGFTPVSAIERLVIVYGNEVQLEFVYYNRYLLATVKPESDHECDMEAVEETAAC